MYKRVKRVAKQILPQQLLEKNEFFFRKLISLKYKGNNFQCNICNFNLDRFVTLDDNDLLCPRCGSRSRTRRLYNELNKRTILKGNVLHFSPPRMLSEQLKKLDLINYYSSDFENEFIADYHYDITAIACESDFFDVIICYHVLEHIEADTKAMSELYRVLKPNGTCFIQTPFKDGDIYEDASFTTKVARKMAFGQDDHVRIYSVEGLKNRLKDTGFKVDIKTFSASSKDVNGLQPETIILVKK